MEISAADKIKTIRSLARLSKTGLAKLLGTSLVSLTRWEDGASSPSPAQTDHINQLYFSMSASGRAEFSLAGKSLFASRGINTETALPLFDEPVAVVKLSEVTFQPLLSRLKQGRYFSPSSENPIEELLRAYRKPAVTINIPPSAGMSAGKNTYTYDAHTYHTKVPPQGIAELLTHYLPDGGLVLDPFAGSGMTGVAASISGLGCILNELSPAACFIANRFISSLAPAVFDAGVKAVLDKLGEVRRNLYSTLCRECGRETEILYTVWSYRVVCNQCEDEFLLWDHCRSYGKRVREHKILTEFSCPNCQTLLKKSRLRRTSAEPVMLGYKCCRGGQQEMMHPLSQYDLTRLEEINQHSLLAEKFYPVTKLPDGMNLRQPINHGLDSVDKFYTPRNLAAMSQLWQMIHRVENPELAAFLGFIFTSLYQRVTRLSEFRFWGGSGNSANFNVPYIFNEANVFLTFARKAKSIRDHLATTARQYRGKVVVVNDSATSLDYLPDESIDLIFTDPPFGGNINYSEMNILWESWLGEFTRTDSEAIINRHQGKGVEEYQSLMTQSLKECHRVLRPESWLLLVFMNSSRAVWMALRTAIADAGFVIRKVDSFDKHHGTFKQFVSENAVGFDLILHCRKSAADKFVGDRQDTVAANHSIEAFLAGKNGCWPKRTYLHVGRDEEIDYQKLYSEWLAESFASVREFVDFAQFRAIAESLISIRSQS